MFTIKTITLQYIMGCVYLIFNGEYHKIGITSTNAEHRLVNLQTGNPNELEVLATYHSTNFRKIEKWFHRKFKDYNCEGEWFILEPEMVNNFTNEAKKIDKNINALKENPFF